MQSRFTQLLMEWHRRHNDRQMPWKGEKDPYRIWLSEVILQQTRVAQGMAYYDRFIQQYPTIHHLAGAPDQQVFKLWEGLGYYNRCRNLLFTARQLSAETNGRFPETYDKLLSLKGVGPYTAAAIASFAFGLPHAVVDGNVFRVLARFFGISEPIDSGRGRELFTGLAAEVLYPNDPGAYNQAIMDFGAVVCKPFAPLCSACPLQSGCVAFHNGTVNVLPVKEKTLLRRNRWFYYFIFEYKGKVLVHERTMKDIWQNLFEFYLVETGEAAIWNNATVSEWMDSQFGSMPSGNIRVSPVMVQQLTHQQVKGQFIHITLTRLPPALKKHTWHPLITLRELPFPRFITQYLDQVLPI